MPGTRRPLLLAVAGAVALGSLAYAGGLADPLVAAALVAGATFALLEAARRRAASPPGSSALGMAPAPALPDGDRDSAPLLLERVSDAVLVLDSERMVLQANPAAGVLFAQDGGALEGRPLMRSTWSVELDAVVAAATGIPQELALPGGRTLLATAFPLGVASRVGLILTEISAARRAERSRSELVANLSHEIRTPVAAARALAETLEAGVDDEARRERYQHQLLAGLDRLTSIVDRALRLSRIEAGAATFDLTSQDPRRLIDTVLLRVAPLAEAAGVRLQDLSESTPPVRADFDRVTEVLTILLDNAIKFSPRESTITVRSFSSGDDPGFVTFEVRDEGPGVLPGERERVFERLYRGDPARTAPSADRAGFGLGLAIARHLVARHGGRIWIHEVPGPGASFRFTLPALEGGAAVPDIPA